MPMSVPSAGSLLLLHFGVPGPHSTGAECAAQARGRISERVRSMLMVCAPRASVSGRSAPRAGKKSAGEDAAGETPRAKTPRAKTPRAAGEDAGAHSLLLRCCSECRSVCELARASEPDGWRERASEEARPVLG